MSKLTMPRLAITYRAARRNLARMLKKARPWQPWPSCVAAANKAVVADAKSVAAGRGSVLSTLKADAMARQRGENADGSARRETVEVAEPVVAAVEPALVADEAGKLHEAPEPAPAKKPRARKPAAPKLVAETETPKAPRKRAAKAEPNAAPATAKPNAAPRRRAVAA